MHILQIIRNSLAETHSVMRNEGVYRMRRLSWRRYLLISTHITAFLGLLASPVLAGPLADIASNMQPGEWQEVTTTSFSGDFITTEGSAIIEFADKAAWDPISRQLFFGGSPHYRPYKFILYNDVNGQWTEPPHLPGLPFNTDLIGHGYQHNAVNPQRGEFYYRPYLSSTVYSYKFSNQTWKALPAILNRSLKCCSALEYFPELNKLVFVDGAWGIFLFDYDQNTWVQVAETAFDSNPSLPNTPMGSYSTFAVYNPVHKLLWFGGGNGDGTKKNYVMDRTGAIRAQSDSPIPLGLTGGATMVITVDPVSGKYLVFQRKEVGSKFYEFDVATNTWSLMWEPGGSGTRLPIYDTRAWSIAAPITNYGVNLFITFDRENSAMYLYKHSEGGGVLIDTLRPNAPAPPSVTVLK